MKVKITPSPVTGTVAAPPSKSYTHRAVILGALAQGETVVASPLLSDDTRYTIEACRKLGIDIRHESDRLVITGCGGRLPAGEREIFAGNSGTTLRLVAGLAALAGGRTVLDGDANLRRRPVGGLLIALRSLGVQAQALEGNGRPPIEICGGAIRGGTVSVRGDVSSQPVSALLMIAPFATETLTIKVAGALHSRPYIDITLDVMQDFGITVQTRNAREFTVRNGPGYRGRSYHIEGDYSSASYFLAAGAIGGGPVTVSNLKDTSRQGDRQLLTLLSLMGCKVVYQADRILVARGRELTGIHLDMGDNPDLVPTMAVVAAFAHGRTVINDIGHLRFKETDRIRALTDGLAKMGIPTESAGGTLVIHGGRPHGTEIDSFGDHRMAMSFAVAALFAEGPSVIHGAETVTKSYPRFFDNLAELGADIKVQA